MSKAEVVVVGEASDKILYINFFKDGESIPDSLYKLQHPGMLEAEKWGNQMINHKGDSVDLNTSVRTNRFFKECVFPVSDPVTGLEEELVAEYKANTKPKPNPETIHPRFHSLWHRVSTRFLDGSLWDDISESGSELRRHSESNVLVSGQEAKSERESVSDTSKNKTKTR